MKLTLLCAALVVANVAVTDSQVDVSPRLVQPSMSGRDIFRYYCASCHGTDGRGNGPVAAQLKTRPADLTKLAATNRGQFPLDRVQALVTQGRPGTPTHGTSDMPVWGPIFQSLDPLDKVARERIDNVLAYIMSIQKK